MIISTERIEVGADLVHLVDEDHARNVVLVGLAPDGLGLRLDALALASSSAMAPSSTRSERSTSMVKSTWPGVSMMLKRIAVALPEGRGRGRRDGDAALLLLLHPVHGGGAVVHFADLVGLAGVIEDALGGRGLAGVDMRHDAEIAVVLDGCIRGIVSVLELALPAVMREGAVGVRHRWVSSRFLTAVPRLLAASSSSPDRRSTMVFSLRLRAAAMSQRMASACRRSVRTSTGTW